MALLGEWFDRQLTVARQAREIRQLKAELEALRVQNASMREGMRRCTTCEYRIDYKQRQGSS